jgi:cell wall-associated NlpC family hydrolase
MIAVCPLSVVPVRKEPSDRSEMVTQLLFGDMAEVVGEEGAWRKIIVSDDGYEGWVDYKQLMPITDEEALSMNNGPDVYCDDVTCDYIHADGTLRLIVIGSRLPAFRDGHFILGPSVNRFNGNTVSPSKPVVEGILRQSMKYLNAPYLWGGKSPFGIDCSGFTQMVFRMNGIALPRDAWQQALKGLALEKEEPLQPGDLAFFCNQEGKVVHVGIVLPEGKIIHASGRVRIDRLDAEGIVRQDDGTRTHTICGVRRFFER